MFKKSVFIALAVALLASPLLARNKGWDWKLSGERTKKLNTFQRSELSKAMKLFEKKNYRAAANQFEKFKVQFDDSEALSYSIFMRAYALHLNRDRNKAIKIYNEVLDFFGDVIDDAAPALYYMGIAHLDNGDTRKGMEAFKEMAEDVDYQKHSLAAGAIRRLADNHWRNKEEDAAVKYWKQVYRDFKNSNSGEANNARGSVARWYVREMKYAEYTSWISQGKKEGDVRHFLWVADDIYKIAYDGFHRWEKYTAFNKKQKKDDMRTFFDWFTSKEQLYSKGKRTWGYLFKKLTFAKERMGDKKVVDAATEDLVSIATTTKNKKERDDKLIKLVDYFAGKGEMARARNLLARVNDHYARIWKEVDLLGREKKYTEVGKTLENIEKMDDKGHATRALQARADLYAGKMGKYEAAIKLYRMIDDPPKTLWAISSCYSKWGKAEQSINTLVEIESAFPSDASSAAMAIANAYHKGGDAKKAIGKCRYIMKQYPKSRAASSAHQMLEKYGIQTGGAIVDEF